ncbi:hypothetical protein M404DRAFT_992416 [Pisolithus tinctorius Marx 270]|uniref:Uncharacterized protein n=1 Tax=Pisolithus tinctorius Marx 270 TaxID=870435 RepID=A0A0C3KX92_PISTI|nr:hypothetical protein M404DRAFT_992416 [Pisolithus tinctorius Marx 270]
MHYGKFASEEGDPVRERRFAKDAIEALLFWHVTTMSNLPEHITITNPLRGYTLAGGKTESLDLSTLFLSSTLPSIF